MQPRPCVAGCRQLRPSTNRVSYDQVLSNFNYVYLSSSLSLVVVVLHALLSRMDSAGRNSAEMPPCCRRNNNIHPPYFIRRPCLIDLPEKDIREIDLEALVLDILAIGLPGNGALSGDVKHDTDRSTQVASNVLQI